MGVTPARRLRAALAAELPHLRPLIDRAMEV